MRRDMSTDRSEFTVATASWKLARIKPCGCWIVNFAQGKAFIACKEHESAILKVLGEP